MDRAFALPAPAKINLFLHVLGRRNDGYHELQTAFALIDLADWLDVERRDDGALRRSGGSSPTAFSGCGGAPCSTRPVGGIAVATP